MYVMMPKGRLNAIALSLCVCIYILLLQIFFWSHRLSKSLQKHNICRCIDKKKKILLEFRDALLTLWSRMFHAIHRTCDSERCWCVIVCVLRLNVHAAVQCTHLLNFNNLMFAASSHGWRVMCCCRCRSHTLHHQFFNKKNFFLTSYVRIDRQIAFLQSNIQNSCKFCKNLIQLEFMACFIFIFHHFSPNFFDPLPTLAHLYSILYTFAFRDIDSPSRLLCAREMQLKNIY